MRMCAAFAAGGNDVTLLVPWRRNLLKEDPFQFYGVSKTFRVKKLPALDLYFARFIPERIVGPLHLFSFLLSAKIYLWYHRPDILYTREIFAGLFFKDFVYEIHSLPEVTTGYFERCLRRARSVVAITRYLREAVLKLGIDPRRVIVEPDAVEEKLLDFKESSGVARAVIGMPATGALVVYTGNFRKWKGVDTLARALHLLPEVQFVMVGGTKESDIARITDLVAGAPNAVVRGFELPERMPHYLAAADVLVMPNARGEEISERYTSPLKLFEYMASNRPIVASDLPSLREILNESNAAFFEADNPESLARVISMVIKDSSLGERIAAQARKDVTPHTWKRRAQRIVAFLEGGEV